jgi:hypothetical protein
LNGVPLKRFALILATIMSSAVPLSLAVPAVPAAAANRLAPADEYFGPTEMSILGIRNELHDAAVSLDADPAHGNAESLARAMIIETAVHEWESKYPGDGWLPRTVYALHVVYRKMSGEQAKSRVSDTAYWLLTKYPDSAEAGLLRSEPLP